MAGEPFGPKLALVLKALTISNGRLAADLAVDKSLVGRWIAGTVQPSAHNLTRLTAHLATRLPGFSLLDWERSRDSLAAVVGGGSSAVPLPPATPGLPFGLIEAAAVETTRRAATYVGRWRVTRRCPRKFGFVHDFAVIRPEGDGLWLDYIFPTHSNSGWLLVLGNKLYSLVADDGHDSFGFFLLNGVVGTRAQRLHGMCCSVDSGATPMPLAMMLVFERVGELGGPAADTAWAERIRGDAGDIDAGIVPDDIAAALTPDGKVAIAGGAAIMRLTSEMSLSCGEMRAAGGGAALRVVG